MNWSVLLSSAQVMSIQQEFEGYQQRVIRHPNLAQYLSMTHAYCHSKITVEVRAQQWVFSSIWLMFTSIWLVFASIWAVSTGVWMVFTSI